MKPALADIARDALLDHLGRGDAAHALRLLVAALGPCLGRACQIDALGAQGQLLWSEGRVPEGPAGTLPLERLGLTLGRLRVQGDASIPALVQELQPVLPTAIELLHHAVPTAPEPGAGGASADLIRAALAGADTFVWEWSIDNDWLSDIDEGLTLLGYTPGEVGHTQEDWNRLIHPDDLAANEEAYRCHERGETFVYEHAYRIRAADGRWHWMQERGRIVERHADGRARRMVGTQSDITQRRAAEAAAQEAMTRLASIARSVPQVLFQSRSGPGGERAFLYISDNCADVLGLTQETLRADGQALYQLILPEDRATEPPESLPATSGEFVNEFRIRRPDGAVRWLRVRSSYQAQGDGSTLWHGSMEDVTERRELEHSREAAAQAQAASRAKTEFLARMSHELRTPLNAVLGFAQLMEMDRAEPVAPGQQRRLRLVREAGEHLLHMINDMLDLTRIESGGLALQPEPVALRALVEQALEMVRAMAEKAQVSLQLLPGAECVVQADPTRMRQVLLNLLTNAIKYNRAGGRVEVTVSATPPGHASVAVRDTGLGIAEADLPRVFEPFHRGDHAGGTIDGAGIGLAVTRALVQLMGGQIHASSVAGAGSVFSVSLPAATHAATHAVGHSST